MLSIMKTMSLEGVNGYLVEIQIDVSGGLPSFDIVGLPDMRVKEARERVRAAIKNAGINFPNRKIVVNLAPADRRKEGTFFDLPMAIGILNAIGEISTTRVKNFESTIFLGELSLDGKIKGINGILPICIEAVQLGITHVVIPKENQIEASIINGLEIIAVENLEEVICYMKGNLTIKEPFRKQKMIFNHKNNYFLDFSEVKGQENVKRALEIAAARLS